MEVVGSGSKRGLGRPVKSNTRLELSKFAGVIAYEPEELILEAGAATPLAEIEALLARHNQHFAFEPPPGGTLGGLLACNLSGPRRIKAGAARDHVLGVAGVAGNGTAFRAGARVVKNVTGYDMPKLMANSFGTLAALTSVIFKVLPAPEVSKILSIKNLDIARGVEAMSKAMGSACEVSAAAFWGGTAFVRLEGIAPSVVARRDALLRLLAEFGRADEAPTWPTPPQSPIIWRVSLPPSDAPGYIKALQSKHDVTAHLDWAGGLATLAFPGPAHHAEEVRGAIKSGHAMLVRAPEEVRSSAPVFHPQHVALAALTRRVKQAFDPDGVLNPGKMYPDL
jgi:glycolate oxidase FAD binding subunit